MRTQRSLHNSSGFTLVELLAVIVIISTLMGVIFYYVGRPTDDAKVVATQMQIKNLCDVIEQFRDRHGRYPRTLRDLFERPSDVITKWPQGGYLNGREEIPKDSWENELQYKSPGDKNRMKFDLYSYGADGKPGGVEYDKDIVNGHFNEE